MKSLFYQPQKNAKVQRNAFDLSQNHVFSAPAGYVLPFMTLECHPNEHYELDFNSFLRTQPLNTAAYARMRQNIEVHFVPMRLMYQYFPQFVVGTNHPITSYNSTSSTPQDLINISFSRQKVYTKLCNLQNLNGSSINLVKNGRLNTGAYDACRLLDLLEYGNFWDFDRNLKNGKTWPDYSANEIVTPSIGETANFRYLPFRIAAYQKICQDNFLNTDYEFPQITAYNFDRFFGSNVASSYTLETQMGDGDFSNLFKLHRCLFKRDYFTSVHASYQSSVFLTNITNLPAFGEHPTSVDDYPDAVNLYSSKMNVVGQVENFLNNTFYSSPEAQQPGFPGTVQSQDNNTTVGVIAGPQGLSYFSASAMRAMFALDKLYRRTIQAFDGSYRSQILAHFGFDVKNDPTRSIFVGSVDAPLTINEVISTADTLNSSSPATGSPVGDIFGRGYSSNSNKTITFDTKEHGILMALFYISPEVDYASLGVNKNLTLFRRENWIQPEFEDLGLEPIMNYEFSQQDVITPQVYGYQSRYANFKTAVDKVHFPFYSFTTPNNIGGGSHEKRIPGSLSAWTTSLHNTFEARSVVFGDIFHCPPSYTNSISQVSFNTYPDSDFCLCNVHATVKAIKNLSVSGTPNL